PDRPRLGAGHLCRMRGRAAVDAQSQTRSGTGPVKWNVFARVRRPAELVAKRINRTVDRFSPGDDLSRPGLGARRIDELRIFVRRARRPGQRLGPGLDLAGNLGPPTGTIRRDLECDPRAFDAADLPAFSKQRADHGRKSS